MSRHGFCWLNAWNDMLLGPSKMLLLHGQRFETSR